VQDVARQQLDSGIQTCKRVHEFLSQMGTLCEQFATGLRRLADENAHSLRKDKLVKGTSAGSVEFCDTLIDMAKFWADRHQVRRRLDQMCSRSQRDRWRRAWR
jgi:hypothetical protein